jgi:hypothetical protein
MHKPSSYPDGADSSDFVDMIDIVFTVVLTIGLTPELLGQGFTGMLSEKWVQAALQTGQTSFNPGDYERLLAFSVGLLTLLFSWFGLHVSLKSKPLKPNNPGTVRFVLDVVLVLSYGLILIFFRHSQYVLLLLAVAYALFLVWDILKTHEYYENYWGEYHRLRKSGTNVARCLLQVFDRQLASASFAFLFWLLWFGSTVGLDDLKP